MLSSANVETEILCLMATRTVLHAMYMQHIGRVGVRVLTFHT
jgi:hypothetical protein